MSGLDADRDDLMVDMVQTVALIALIASGEAREAQRAADDILDTSRRSGDALAFAEASAVRGFAMYNQGQIAEATADAHAAIDATNLGWGTIAPIPHAVLAQCLIEVDELEAADRLLTSIGDGPQADTTLYAFYYWARARLSLARGDAQGAVADYARCRELLTKHGMDPNPAACSWRCPAALAHRAAGNELQARKLVDEELALSRLCELPGHLGEALHVLAILDGPAAGEEHLEQAIELLERADRPLQLARAVATAGSWLRLSGKRVESREPLRRALELAHGCGAKALENQVHAELLASGARPR